MTKRLLALFLVCILAIPILAVPASASQVTGTQFDQFTLGLGNLLNDIESNILDWLETINSNIGVINRNVISWFDAINTNMVNKFDAMHDSMAYWLGLIDTRLTNIYYDLGEWWADQTEWWTEHLSLLREIKREFIGLFNPDWQSNASSWFYQLYDVIGDLVDGEYRSQINQIGDEIVEQDQQFQENQEVIQEVTRPDYESVVVDPEVLQGNVNEVAIYGENLKWIITSSEYFYHMLFLAFTFSLISYTVFGKR